MDECYAWKKINRSSHERNEVGVSAIQERMV